MFQLDADGRLIHTDLIYSCGKKGGKTEFAALMLIVTLLLFGGPNAEGYAIANDLEQAQSRVFERCRRIVAASPLLVREAKITSDRIVFTWVKEHQRVQLCDHRIFTPRPDAPIDFTNQIEQTLIDWHRRFNVKSVWYDPFQMASSAQRLLQKNVRMVEYPQTPANLTAMGENLFNLIRGRNLLVYPDEQIRTAVLRAIAVEGSRGWKIDKVKQSHHIDIVVGLGMAALAAVRAQTGFDIWEMLRDGEPAKTTAEQQTYAARNFQSYLLGLSGFNPRQPHRPWAHQPWD
jgi:phage terminase large subunit-like protein